MKRGLKRDETGHASEASLGTRKRSVDYETHKMLSTDNISHGR